MSTAESRRDPYQAVTDMILEQLEIGVVPWRCPWNREVGCPSNFTSGKPYRGINVMLLGWRHFSSPWWLTYRQAQERGGYVRKGESGTMVVKYGTFRPKDSEPANDEAGKSSETSLKSKSRFLRTFTVFNAMQIEGIAFPAVPSPSLTEERHAQAEGIIKAMPNPPQILERDITRAYYSKSLDEVQTPRFAQFESADSYYATVFHELTHATGHESRLNRDTLTKHDEFGGPIYSREELVAEMGSAFLCMEANIARDRHEQSAAYLQSWLTVLKVKENRKWIVQAASQAARATDFILNRQAEVGKD